MNKILSSVIKGRISSVLSPFCYRNIIQQRCFFYLTSIDHHRLHYQLDSSFHPSVSHERQSNFLSTTKQKLKSFISDNTKVKISGCLVYEKIGDDIDYNEFFKCFELPDTFYSWFLCMQLHVWMTITTSVPVANGRLFRNSLVEAMWNDVEFRMSKLDYMKREKKDAHLKELTGQFQASIMSYDEGILSDDTVLASAVWRTLYSGQPVDPQLIEKAVFYIRKQLSYLDSLNNRNIILDGSVSFLTLNSIFSDYKE